MLVASNSGLEEEDQSSLLLLILENLSCFFAMEFVVFLAYI